MRHGQTGQVHQSMVGFDKDGKPTWKFDGEAMLRGETDGSSYQNGGMRATHRAGGYLAMDPTSPPFLRGDTIFIPSCFVSYLGHALDEKTPLLRSLDALNVQGTRLCKLLGFDVPGIQSNIGLEQEIFFIPREHFKQRVDLQMTGRTVIGQDAPRGQEMCDHYMAPPNMEGKVLDCMREIQNECFKIGIPLKTRHREVAPNQYEFAPEFGLSSTQTDQNLMVMQIMEEVAAKHGLACLLQEKPFSNVNGSGKHNNWSIGTTDGKTNLFNPNQTTNHSKNNVLFPLVMSAIIKAVDEHGDLMRMSIASPGNDFRLGACEAPPAIISTFLGEQMTGYLEDFKKGKISAYAPKSTKLNTGVASIGNVSAPAQDRNRTSPFPYGGHRFEFRAVGSSQNVSMVNTVLNAITAKSFKEFADAIEGGASPEQVARDALSKHWKAVFNDNGYDISNQEKLTKAGVWRIDSNIDAIQRLEAPKNVKLFDELNIMTAEETLARQSIMLSHYMGTVEMETLCLVDMLNKHVIPSATSANGPVDKLRTCVSSLQTGLQACHAVQNEAEKAKAARKLRLETIEGVRKVCDEFEAVCPAKDWTLSTYRDLLFLDQTD